VAELKFKGLLLDIDNTLYDYRSAHERAMQAVENELVALTGLAAADIRSAFADARNSIHSDLKETAASHNRLLYFQRMFERLGINPLLQALPAYTTYWDTFLDGLVLDDGVLDFLEMVRGLKICFVTDLTAHIQYRKIEKLCLFNYAGYIVTSEEAGREKPHASIFELALSKLSLPLDEVCMIGDSYEKDVLGATALGLHTFWLNRDVDRKQLSDRVTEFSHFSELGRAFQ